jgi:hypothetical protein
MLEVPGLRIESTTVESVSKMLADLRAEPSYTYPWDSLERDIEERGETAIPVIGYGSLINSDSAIRTLTEISMATSRPAVAFGIRRIFNYEMPETTDRYGPPTDPKENAALNAFPTGRVEDVINGICISVTLADIPAFRRREVGYDLVRVPCIEWEAPDRPPFAAYVLCLPEGSPRMNDSLLPHRRYYLVCRGGAAQVGDDYLRLWLATTRLADDATPVGEWESSAFPAFG